MNADLLRGLLYMESAGGKRECNCPPWVRCAHFEGKAVVLTARDGSPPEHVAHLPDQPKFSVYFYPDYFACCFETCDECGTERGMSTGPWDKRPTRSYYGDDADAALATFDGLEARMLGEVR